MTLWTLALLIAAALGSGLMAGLFCSFSSFIMQALAEIPRPSGIAAMQSINRVIVKPDFLLVFFGTGVASALAVGFGWQELNGPARIWTIAGGAVYVVGCLVVTMLFNVPLNNRLEAVDAQSEEGAKIWATYLVTWVRWNHLRSLATILSTVFLIVAALHAKGSD